MNEAAGDTTGHPELRERAKQRFSRERKQRRPQRGCARPHHQHGGGGAPAGHLDGGVPESKITAQYE